MKRLFTISALMLAGMSFLMLNSCAEEPAPAPTVQISVSTDGYNAIIALQSTNATSYAWDYGDGMTSTEMAGHTYTYDASGTYTITVVATGEGGTAEASQTVTIAASVEEIIAGTAAAGKAWVLTNAEATFSGKIGPGAFENTFSVLDGYLVPSNVMVSVGGFDAGEYNDEFIFYPDGKFAFDNKNGSSLAAYVYAGVSETATQPSASPGDLPLALVNFNNITDGTWALNRESITRTVFNEFSTGVVEDVTLTFGDTEGAVAEAELVLSSGAYVGFYDLTYPDLSSIGKPGPSDNSLYVIKEITPERMVIAVAMNGVPFLDDQGNASNTQTLNPIFDIPTMFLHLVLVPKQ